MDEPIYMDHAATTPLREEVRAAMEPFLGARFGNPSSLHRWGRETAEALEQARSGVAESLGARPREILFVRGGTESDNLAVLGRAAAARGEGRRPHVVHSAVEHPAVEEAAEAVEAAGGRRTVVPVRPDGTLDEAALDEALAVGPDLLSVMWVNNETGQRLPVPELAARARAAGVALHTDAVQAVGKVPVRVDDAPVALLTLTGHKIYGPRGTGVLFVREGTALSPLLHGGGQERGLRPGTEDVAGAVGMAEALRLAVAEQGAEAIRLEGLRDRLEAGLRARVEGLRVHAAEGPRAPHVSNVGIPGVERELLLAGLDMAGVACSAGSACHSGAMGGSRVLRALYGDEAARTASLRFSLGKATTAEAVDRVVEAVAGVVARLRGGGRSGPAPAPSAPSGTAPSAGSPS